MYVYAILFKSKSHATVTITQVFRYWVNNFRLHPGGRVCVEGGSASRGGLPGVCAHQPPGLPTGRSASRGSAHPPPSLPTGGLHPGEGVCLGGCIQRWGSASGVGLPTHPQVCLQWVCIGGDVPNLPQVCLRGGGVGQTSLPPVNRMTHRCKNITLSQTSFVGGKK